MSYHISPEIFFLVEENKLLMWNCKTHEQFLLSREYSDALLNLKNNQNQDIYRELMAAGAISIDEETKSCWGWDPLSRLFHVGTKDVPTNITSNDEETYFKKYITECHDNAKHIPKLFQEKNSPIIDLPKPDLTKLKMPLFETYMNRKTSRDFNYDSIDQEELSNILYSTFGLIHDDWQTLGSGDLKIVGIRKSSPSSGALHATEAYVVIYNVKGLEKGLYYYRPQDHKLNFIAKGNFENTVLEFNKNQFFSKGVAAGIYLTSRLEKYWWKYNHSRTYRIALMDIGHVSQSLLLSTTSLGLKTWMTAVFHDSEIENFLEIDGYTESVMLFVGIGHGSNQTFPQEYFKEKL